MTQTMQRRITTALADPPQSETRRLLRRLNLQIAFARAFADAVPPDVAHGWPAQIAEAQKLLADYDPSAGMDGLAATVSAAEAAMAELGQTAKQYTIHCVGHGHIDMNWMWSWPETVATTHDTFASALRLMEQYPDFTFSQSQASVYALMERYHPALFAQIQQRVEEGRWEVTAAHWVEGDKNIASGESLCRHLLYTRQYFADRFGLSPEDLPIDWEPDTFGHAVTLPSLLAQGAVKYYYSCRQGGGFDHLRLGDPRPPLFWWQGPDGARVLVNRETTWYNSFENLTENIALPLAAFVKETGLRDWLNVYGVGNHGGGPTRAEIDYYRELQEWPIYPQVVFSTNKAYFEAVQRQLDSGLGERLPVLAHELNFEFTGCYTSQSLIKQANRFGENYLEEAETLALLAARLGGPPVPKERLREAWLSVLFSQFHDILPGSGVRETREYAMAQFQEVGAITGAIKRNALGTLSGRINTRALLPDTWEGRQERAGADAGEAAFEAGAGLGARLTGLSVARGGGSRFRPYVVYNPCAWPCSGRVMATLYDTGFAPAQVVARDEEGNARPTLVVSQAQGWDAWGHSKIDVVFDAQDIPALGYRTYLLHEGATSGQPLPSVTRRPQDWFETPTLRFRLDRDRGGLLELWDKRTNAQLVGEGSGPLGALALVTERSRGMTAWTLGNEVDPPLSLESTSFTVLGGGTTGSSGTVPTESPAGFQADWTLAIPGTQSTVRLSLAIHALEPRLDWTAEIDWREIGNAERGIPGLTVRFPLALSGLTSRYEAPFGSVERTLFGGEEVPTLRYAHFSGTARTPEGSSIPAGLTLLQDCKHGHSVHGNELRMRVVRSSFDPDHAPEVAQSRVRYSLVLHDGPADPAETARLGAAWNHPLIVLPIGLQDGDAPARRGFAEVQTPSVVLSALKAAEDGDGLILRLAEMNGQDTEAVVVLDPGLAAGATRAQLLDLMERPTGASAAWDGRVLRVSIKAYGFVTVGIS